MLISRRGGLQGRSWGIVRVERRERREERARGGQYEEVASYIATMPVRAMERAASAGTHGVDRWSGPEGVRGVACSARGEQCVSRVKGERRVSTTSGDGCAARGVVSMSLTAGAETCRLAAWPGCFNGCEGQRDALPPSILLCQRFTCCVVRVRGYGAVYAC